MGTAFPILLPLIRTTILPFSLCSNSNVMKSRAMYILRKYAKSTRGRVSVLLQHHPRVFPVICVRGDRAQRVGLGSRKVRSEWCSRILLLLDNGGQAPPADCLCSSCCGRLCGRSNSKCAFLGFHLFLPPWTCKLAFASGRVDQLQPCVRYNNRNKRKLYPKICIKKKGKVKQ